MKLEELLFNLKPEDTKTKLFKIKTIGELVKCCAVMVNYVRNGKALHVQIVSPSKFKFEEIRAAYFAYLTEFKNSSKSPGQSVPEMHEFFKKKFMLKLLAMEYDWFANLVIASVKDEDVSESVNRLLSIADGSIVTSPILIEYFRQVQEYIQENYDF